jgi:hypothetical protein
MFNTAVTDCTSGLCLDILQNNCCMLSTSFPGLSYEDEARDEKALVWAGQFCIRVANTILSKNN